MNRILCPIDFSKASLTALEFAIKIAEKHGSSINLIHVITSQEYNVKLKEAGEETFNDIHLEIGNKLKVLCEEINNSTSNEYEICRYEILSGDLTSNISEVIEKENVAMIVMGTNGASDVTEARMGSNTVKIINRVHIPVLAIPGNSEYHDFDRIVYGSEMSEDDNLFLQQVINFALPFNSHLYLVHIADRKTDDGKGYKEYAETIKSYFDYKKLFVEEFVTSEDVSIALEHTLNVHDAHLLVLVHKSRNLLENIFHRSLTKKMSYLTNFPLLALRN